MLLGLSHFFARGGYRCALGAVILILSPMAITRAATLQDGDSTLQVNPDSSVMNYSWLVDGVDVYGGSPAGQESFFFSLGNAAPQPLSALTHIVVYNSDGLLTVKYTDPGEFSILLSDVLSGGTPGSGNAALTELLSIDNKSGAALDLHILQFVDFNAAEADNNYTLSLSSSPTNVTDQIDTLGDHFNVAVDIPDEYQIANDSSVYMKMSSPTFVPLNDNSTGPMSGATNFAFEWDPNLSWNGTDQISITESVQNRVVPLPTAAWAALSTLAGIAAVAGVRRLRAHIA
jgi:hypothetical protein